MSEHDSYSPLSLEELEHLVGENPSEAVDSLVRKGILVPHHDGGYSFNADVVDEILSQEPGGDSAELG